jgi:uncharacterized membrane protein
MASVAVLLGCEIADAYLRGAPLVVWALKLAPVLIVLPGVLRDRMRSVVWLSFVSLLYFLFAVQRLFAEPASLRAQLELVAVVLLFLCSMFYVRWRARELRAANEDAS